MLINCVLFIFDIVYEKKLKGRVLGSSQKGHKYCFLLEKKKQK